MLNRKQLTKTFLIILAAIIIILSSTGGYVYYSMNKMKKTTISKNDKDLGIKETTEKPKIQPNNKAMLNKVVNIALFGLDSRMEKYEAKHSDSIMILSLDKAHNKIKLSSIMRDTYVHIENHKNNKINTAYAYGGPELAVKTLNENFNMDIRDYVTVNFLGLSEIIDALDGVSMNVKENEIKEINKYMKEVAHLKNVTPTPIKKSGIQNLNGIQAVAYARIRHVGNGDFERTERQKLVLSEIIAKIQKQGIAKYPYLISKISPYIETSLSQKEILNLASELFNNNINAIDWYRFPIDQYCTPKIINKVWYLSTDIPITTEHIHKFIYDDIKVTSKNIQAQDSNKKAHYEKSSHKKSKK